MEDLTKQLKQYGKIKCFKDEIILTDKEQSPSFGCTFQFSCTKENDSLCGGRDRTFSSGKDAILNIFYYDNGAPKSFELITEDIPNKISDVNYGIVPGAPGGACAQGSSPTGFYDRNSLCVPEEGCALRNGEFVDADAGPAGCIQFRDTKEHRSFPMKCCKQSIRRRRLWNKWGNKNTGDC